MPWESIYEGNPQQILERGEKVTLPPMFIMQGELDDNVIPPIQEKFAETYTQGGRRVRARSLSKAAATCGSPSRDRRPTARTRW